MPPKIDVDKLNHALTNQTNSNIIDIDFKQIEQDKLDILKQLPLTKTALSELMKKLKLYRNVNTLQEIQYGRYIRWIPLTKGPEVKLTNGGILCNIKTDRGEVTLVFKNKINSFFQINLTDNIVFQKLTEQELVILTAINCLS
jgi:hypothetical protein